MRAATIIEASLSLAAVSGSWKRFILGRISSCGRTDGLSQDEMFGIGHHTCITTTVPFLKHSTLSCQQR